MATLLDGRGRGYNAAVNLDNHLRTRAVTETIEHYVNEEKGKSFSIRIDNVTPTGAGDVFFYLKNTSTSTVVLEGIEWVVGSAESIEVVIGDVGTPSGGTDITPTNLNAGSSATLTGTIQSGANITGLTKGNVAYKVYNDSTAKTEHYNFDQDIILPQGGVVAFYAVTGAIAIDMNINVYEVTPEA